MSFIGIVAFRATNFFASLIAWRRAGKPSRRRLRAIIVTSVSATFRHDEPRSIETIKAERTRSPCPEHFGNNVQVVVRRMFTLLLYFGRSGCPGCHRAGRRNPRGDTPTCLPKIVGAALGTWPDDICSDPRAISQPCSGMTAPSPAPSSRICRLSPVRQYWCSSWYSWRPISRCGQFC